jgi:hypothetical protein
MARKTEPKITDQIMPAAAASPLQTPETKNPEQARQAAAAIMSAKAVAKAEVAMETEDLAPAEHQAPAQVRTAPSAASPSS